MLKIVYIYIEHRVESDDIYPKFEVGDHVIISKYKNIFTKVHAIYLNY